MVAQRSGRVRFSLMFAILAMVTGAACGGGSDGGGAITGPDGGQTGGAEAPSAPAANPGAPEYTLIVRGTEGRPPPDGWVEVPGACGGESDELGPMSTHVPADWQPGGGSNMAEHTAAERGGVAFLVGDAGRRVGLEVDLLRPEDNLGGVPATDNFSGMEGADVVHTFEWGGQDVDVLYDGSVYTSLLPVMTMDGEGLGGVPEGEFLMKVQIRHQVDEPDFESTIIEIFESLQSHECMAEPWATMIQTLTVEIES